MEALEGGSFDIEDLMKGKHAGDIPAARDRKWQQAGVKTRINKKKCDCNCSDTVSSCHNGEDEEHKQCQSSCKPTAIKKTVTVKKEDDDETGFAKSIPGTQKIFVKTFGCSHNVSDSEYMMGQLVDYGYGIVPNPDEADLILVNSCTVKNPSQDAFLTYYSMIPQITNWY